MIIMMMTLQFRKLTYETANYCNYCIVLLLLLCTGDGKYCKKQWKTNKKYKSCTVVTMYKFKFSHWVPISVDNNDICV